MKSRTLYNIQACRAIAAVLVVVFHTSYALSSPKYFSNAIEPLRWLLSWGGPAGVDFFFVLSGFIIHQAHFSESGDATKLRPYLLKRVIRVYPIYWTVFAFVSIGLLLFPGGQAVPEQFAVLLKSLALLPQQGSDGISPSAPVVVVAWSLQFEIYFYCLFAIRFVNARLFGIVCLAIILSMIPPFFVKAYAFYGSFFTNHLVLLFMFGLLASIATLRRKAAASHPGVLLTAIGLLLVVYAIAINFINMPFAAGLDIVFGAGCALCVYALTESEKRLGAAPLARWLTPLGNASYSLYLVHYPLVSLLCKILSRAFPHTAVGGGSAFVLILASCIAASLAFHRTIELPLLAWLKARQPTPNIQGTA